MPAHLAPPAQKPRPARHVYLKGVRRESCRGAPWDARDRRVLALWRARNTGEGGRMAAQGYSCEPETPPSATGIRLTHPLNDGVVARTPNAGNPACWSWHLQGAARGATLARPGGVHSCHRNARRVQQTTLNLVTVVWTRHGGAALGARRATRWPSVKFDA